MQKLFQLDNETRLTKEYNKETNKRQFVLSREFSIATGYEETDGKLLYCVKVVLCYNGGDLVTAFPTRRI